jgi:hypothetical protein
MPCPNLNSDKLLVATLLRPTLRNDIKSFSIAIFSLRRSHPNPASFYSPDLLVFDTAIFTPFQRCLYLISSNSSISWASSLCLQRCQYLLPLPLAFFRVFFLFEMGTLNCLNPIYNISHFIQASFSEFIIDVHNYTSRNPQNRLLPSPSVVLKRSLTMSLQPNYVNVYGHITTPYTFLLC